MTEPWSRARHEEAKERCAILKERCDKATRETGYEFKPMTTNDCDFPDLLVAFQNAIDALARIRSGSFHWGPIDELLDAWNASGKDGGK